MKLYKGDCLEVMKGFPDSSVDMVLTDPPYGTTACKWDSVIPFEPMWEQLKRIIKPRGAIILTASQPFTSALIMSNIKMFKYCWVWEKEQGSMPMNAPYQPIKVHEDVTVFGQRACTFSKKGTMQYNPQKTVGLPYEANCRKETKGGMVFHSEISKKGVFKNNKGDRYPRSVQRFNCERGLHPTQKPVELMEYLIKTYTNPEETVLDFTMGSGTTGVAAMQTGRDFIGIELDDKYFKIANDRINLEITRSILC